MRTPRIIILVILSIFLFASISQAAAVGWTSTTQELQKINGFWTDTTAVPITTTNNTCTPLTTTGRSAVITIQVAGTWGGGTLTFWGSNDGGTTWFALTSRQTSAAMSFTANGHGTVLSIPVKQIKWILAGGDGTTSINAYVVGQR